MPGVSRRLLALAACAIATTAVVPMSSAAQTAPAVPTADQVQAAQRAALVSRLGATSPRLAAAERQLGDIQAQLLQTRRQQDTTNTRLRTVQRQITDNQQILDTAQAQLATMLRQNYVDGGRSGLTTSLLSSGSFTQAFDRYSSGQHASEQLVGLVQKVDSVRTTLRQQQSALQANIAQGDAVEHQLSVQADHMTALVAARDLELATAPRAARGLVATLDNTDNQLAAGLLSALSPGSAVNVQGPCGNHFSYGQCTWYVASRRCIPWLGNAYEWWSSARAAGYQEGKQPAVGAVVVWYPGGGGAGSVGHVGYVEAVGPSDGVPAGSFKLSEMNWNGGWGHVDYRVLPDNASGIDGFIYGRQ